MSFDSYSLSFPFISLLVSWHVGSPYFLNRFSSSSNSRSVVRSMLPVLDITEVVALLRFFLNPDL